MTDKLHDEEIRADGSADIAVEKTVVADDGIQHGIDDNPEGDAAKGAALGGVGSAIVGGLAGAATGPVGIAVGAAVGAVAGTVVSGGVVAGVDAVDNDNNVTGVGDGVTPDSDLTNSAPDVDNDVIVSNDNVVHNAKIVDP
jgi:hypothetical protein